MQRRFVVVLLAALCVLGVSAMPASAATLKLSVSANAKTPGQVAFTAKTSRRSAVRIWVYKGGKLQRSVAARRVGGRYKATWHRPVGSTATATFTYRVTAVASRRLTRTVRGKVRVGPAHQVLAATDSWIGFYQSGSPASIAPLQGLESLLGTKAAVINFYVADSEPFPASRIATIRAHGSTPLLTLEFWSLKSGGLTAITNGSEDAYLSAFADGAKKSGTTIWLRPFHEMNGNWYPWAGTVGSNSPAQLIAAWRHVHDIFASRGATNVKFVWCVNNESVPSTAENAISSYWPGDAYVDYTSVDLYNFGTYASWSHWTPFASAFAAPYAEITGLSGKPMFLAELGCVEQGGDKAAWVADAFTQMRTRFTHVSGFVWFNVNDGEDWRVESSQRSIDAFKSQAAQGL